MHKRLRKITLFLHRFMTDNKQNSIFSIKNIIDFEEKALEVFKYNAKTNKGVWPTNYGLARGYSAVGDYKNALKYLKLAKENVPANDTLNGPIIDQNIAKLEKGEDIN